MLSDYLKPEYKDTDVARVIAKFQNTNPAYRMVLRVPVAYADTVTAFLKRSVSDNYTFHRRAGGGVRRDSMALTCRVADATYFKFYFDKVNVSGTPARCAHCGQLLP